MNLLESLALFVRIIERGGLAAAGRDLGLSPAVVTERLASIESHYGTKLLNRTTRAISLTDEGRVLLDSARQLLSDAHDIEARIRLGSQQLSGMIKLSASLDLGRHLIAQLLDEFILENPEVSIELVLSDGYVDIVGQGLDLAIRLGELKDSSLHAVKLGENQRMVCAAPSYIEANALPSKPSDLLDHNCLLMRFGAGVDREWSFMENGQKKIYTVGGNRIANDGGLVRTWCIQGHGIALKSYWDIKNDLDAGRLVRLLNPYLMPASSIQILYPGGRAVPKRVRALIDFLVVAFVNSNKQIPY